MANDPYKARGTDFQGNSSDFFATGYQQLMPTMTPFGKGFVGDLSIGVMMG